MKRLVLLAGMVAMLGVFFAGGVALAKGFEGTSGPDKIRGTTSKDRIWGKGGDDKLNGRGGGDRIDSGRGADLVRGGDGDDYIITNDRRTDTVYCGSGKDFVYASRSDVVYFGCETVRIDRD